MSAHALSGLSVPFKVSLATDITNRPRPTGNISTPKIMIHRTEYAITKMPPRAKDNHIRYPLTVKPHVNIETASTPIANEIGMKTR